MTTTRVERTSLSQFLSGFGAGQDGYAIVYDHGATPAWIPGTFEPAGSVATHAALTQAHGISAFGATLVDDANAAAARSTLELGTMATQATGSFLAATGATTGATAAIQPFTLGIQTGKVSVLSNSTNAWGLYAANGTTQQVWLDSVNGFLGVGILPVRTMHINGTLRVDSTGMLYDNRNNAILQQSASGVASNRDLTIGNATYANALFGFKGIAFGPTIASADLGSNSAMFMVSGGTSTGSFGLNIILAGQAGASGNNNGGHIIIDPGAPTGSGTTGVIRLGATRGNVAIGQNTANNKLDVAGTVQADGLRLDVTPIAETPAMTHTITISVNGTNYKLPCALA